MRLIGAGGENKGVLALADALREAEDNNLDLVEIAPDSNPPVCRLLDYGKFKYQAQKRASESRRRQKTITIKEIKIRPTIDDHDYAVKMRNMRRFFAEGDKVKVSLRFRGREMTRPELGMDLLQKLAAEMAGEAKIEAEPKLEGRQMVMVLAPAGKPAAKTAPKSDPKSDSKSGGNKAAPSAQN